MKYALMMLNILIFSIGTMGVIHKATTNSEKRPIAVRPIQQYTPLPPAPTYQPVNPSITNHFPSYKNYAETTSQLKEWQREAPSLAQVGTYGRSTRGHDLYYIRIFNKELPAVEHRPVVLITSCIHGNEPLSASTTMAMIGSILKDYGDNEEITNLVDSRDIYFVPVVSPDSYPHSRRVDGVDPNRNFPGPRSPNRRSVAPVAAIQNFFKQIKAEAVISGHTWGRVFLVPYGDTNTRNPNWSEYQRIIGQMCRLSGYKMLRAYDLYTAAGLAIPGPIRVEFRPIYGTEVDWYYRQGAFAIVCEFGRHQRIPTDQDIRVEFDKTYKAFLHFIEEAPLVKIQQ
jgi:hypothetical protein